VYFPGEQQLLLRGVPERIVSLGVLELIARISWIAFVSRMFPKSFARPIGQRV
jgi:hypothetical protein